MRKIMVNYNFSYKKKLVSDVLSCRTAYLLGAYYFA